MKCDYCLTENQTGEHCEKCGAPLPKQNDDFWKSEPFFYNGYICYTLRELMTDMLEVQFWLGRELIERIKIPRDVVVKNVPEICTTMPFFWDLFLVARGEKEVLEYQERNKKYPATFEIRRIENPEKERICSLTPYELVREFIR